MMGEDGEEQLLTQSSRDEIKPHEHTNQRHAGFTRLHVHGVGVISSDFSLQNRSYLPHVDIEPLKCSQYHKGTKFKKSIYSSAM